MHYAGVFGLQPFMRAFSVVMAHALYLPSASCFALVPVASTLGRTGAETGCTLDYDAESGVVVVRTTRAMRCVYRRELYVYMYGALAHDTDAVGGGGGAPGTAYEVYTTHHHTTLSSVCVCEGGGYVRAWPLWHHQLLGPVAWGLKQGAHFVRR